MRESFRIDRLIRGCLLAGGLLMASVVLAGAQAKPNKAGEPSAKPVAAASASYVGSAACKACHAKTCEPWSVLLTAKPLPRTRCRPKSKAVRRVTGPASAHIGSGAQNKPRVPKANDAKGAPTAICGACHFQNDTSKAPKEWQNISGGNFARSMHGRKGLVLSFRATRATPTETTKRSLSRERTCVLAATVECWRVPRQEGSLYTFARGPWPVPDVPRSARDFGPEHVGLEIRRLPGVP